MKRSRRFLIAKSTVMQRRRLRFEALESRRLLNVDWRNPTDNLDVDADGVMSPLDVLTIVNDINSNGTGALPAVFNPTRQYIDTNGSGTLEPLDVLEVINFLNASDSSLRTVTDANAGSAFLVQQSITVTLGSDTGTRKYRMQVDPSFGQNSGSRFSPDVFSVYLVNPADQNQTLLDRGVSGTSLFSISPNGVETAPGLATWDGQFLEIDFGAQQLRTLDTAVLKLQLLNSNPSQVSRIVIRPIENAKAEDLSPAILMTSSDPKLVPGGAINLGSLSNTTTLRGRMGNVRFDAPSNRFTADVGVENLGDAIGRSVVMVLTGLPTGAIVSNASGTDSQGRPYLNLTEAIRSGGLAKNAQSDVVEVQIDNPRRLPLNLQPLFLVGPPNRIPTLAPISNQSIMPGGHAEIKLTASDADGDAISFTAIRRNGGVLPGVTIDTETSTLILEPSPLNLGTHTIDVIATDGTTSTTQSFTLNVVSDPITTTRIKGQIVEPIIDSQGNETLRSISGMLVEIGTANAITDANGRFEIDLGSPDPAVDTLRIRGESYAGSVAYPYLGEKLPEILGHSLYLGYRNEIRRPIFIPRLDTASGTVIDPAKTSTVNSSSGASMSIPPGNLTDQLGRPFNGLLSITEVTPDRTPISLPDGLRPDVVVTVQPADLRFTSRRPITLPNRANYPLGTILDLWSINPTTGLFEVSGSVKVVSSPTTGNPNRTILETISGGVLFSSWHFAARPRPTPIQNDDRNLDEACPSCVSQDKNFVVETHAGATQVEHSLAPYYSAGSWTGVTLHYDSMRADPRPIVAFGYENLFANSTQRMVATLSLRKGDTVINVPGYTGNLIGTVGGEHFWKIGQSGTGRGAIQADLTDASTGIYEYTLKSGPMQYDGKQVSGTLAIQKGTVVVVNSVRGPFGAGWGLSGLKQIHEQADGTLLIVDGDGSQIAFKKPATANTPYLNPPGDFSMLVKNSDGSFKHKTTTGTESIFSAEGRLLSITDRNSNRWSYFYDGDGVISRITDPANQQTTFTKTGGRITSITDPAGRVTRIEYDNLGNLVSIQDPDESKKTYGYDTSHRLIAETNKNGQTERLAYDIAGRAKVATRADGTVLRYDPIQSQLIQPVALTTNPQNAPSLRYQTEAKSTFIDANGVSRTKTIDGLGQEISSRDNAGTLNQIKRNANNQIVSSTDSRGSITKYYYDEKGNTVRIEDSQSRPPIGSVNNVYPNYTLATPFGPTDIQLADVNADGFEDAIVSNRGSSSGKNGLSLFLRNSSGGFNPQEWILQGITPESIAVGDFNDDSIVDIAANDNGTVSLLTGTSESKFILQAVTQGPGGFGKRVDIADLNGDTRLDLVLYGTTDFAVMLNNGDGTFQPLAAQKPDPVYSLFGSSLGDLDGDGKTDLVFATNQSYVLSMRGNGNGTFGAPVQMNVVRSAKDVEIGDINSDQIPDLVIMNTAANSVDQELTISLGLGGGSFGTSKTIPLSYRSKTLWKQISIVDINQDGNADLVAGGDVACFGTSSGDFLPAVKISDTGTSLRGVAFTDVDNNGMLDIVRLNTRTTNGEIFTVFSKSNQSFFQADSLDYKNNPPGSIVTGDFNKDGYIDILGSPGENSGTNLIHLFTGSSSGKLTSAISGSNYDYRTYSTFADITNDGRLDIVMANSFYPNKSGGSTLANDVSFVEQQSDGTLKGTELFVIGVGNRPVAIVPGLINSDSFTDLVIANYSSNTVSVLINSGRVSSTPGFQRTDYQVGTNPRSIAIADINNDNISDVVVANQSSSISILIGSPNGAFQAASTINLNTNGVIRDTTEVAIKDINSDGRLDIIASNELTDDVSCLFGNGDGTFQPEVRYTVGDKPVGLAVGDINGDGINEILTANSNSADISIRYGNGDGSFDFESRLRTGPNPKTLVLEDVNKDGVLDILVSNDSPDASPAGTADILVFYGRRSSVGFGSPNRGITFTYDPIFNQVASVTDDMGRKTEYEIDPQNGNRLSMRRIMGLRDSSANGETDDLVTRYTYTTFGLVDTITDPLGRITDHTYDTLGRLTSLIHAKGTADEITQYFEYDTFGNPERVIDGLGKTTSIEYDLMNRRKKVTTPDPDGNGPLSAASTQFKYDLFGNMTEKTDAQGGVSTIQYDKLNRPSKTISQDPDGAGPLSSQVIVYGYDGSGNLAKITDGNGNVTQYTYDSRNRRISQIDALGGKSYFRYDGNGNLVSLVDPEGNRTRFQYDSRNQLIRETDPLGQASAYQYDFSGNLLLSKDRNGRTTKYRYDDANRLVLEEWIATNQTVLNSIDYNYDKSGNLRIIDDAFSTIGVAYDAMNRPSSTSNAGTPKAPLVEYVYRYNKNGLRTSSTQKIGGQDSEILTYQYDGEDRLSTLIQTGNGVNTKVVDFVYNQIGQLSNLKRYADSQRTTLIANSNYNYDAQNRLRSIEHGNSVTARAIAFYDYEYDGNSQLTRISDIDGATNYSYDKTQQLKVADRATGDARGDEFYNYDQNGNRTSSHLSSEYTKTGGNRLSSDSEFTYTYDHEGNLVKRIEISTSIAREYFWDHRNRLIRVTDKSSGGIIINEALYTYDALNRRIARTVDTDGAGPNSPFTEHYAYNGEHVALEFLDADGPGTVQQPVLAIRNLFGPKIDMILAQEIEKTNETRWLLTDHLGTVRDILSNTGVVLNHIKYDSFGNILSQSNPSAATRYAFTGREWDSSLGLYYYRARYYDANLGKFLSEDPLGFSTGDTNLSRYVKNVPLSRLDPSGLEGILVGGRDVPSIQPLPSPTPDSPAISIQVPPVPTPTPPLPFPTEVPRTPEEIQAFYNNALSRISSIYANHDGSILESFEEAQDRRSYNRQQGKETPLDVAVEHYFGFRLWSEMLTCTTGGLMQNFAASSPIVWNIAQNTPFTFLWGGPGPRDGYSEQIVIIGSWGSHRLGGKPW
jgi:RHS repeat-associated protein